MQFMLKTKFQKNLHIIEDGANGCTSDHNKQLIIKKYLEYDKIDELLQKKIDDTQVYNEFKESKKKKSSSN